MTDWVKICKTEGAEPVCITFSCRHVLFLLILPCSLVCFNANLIMSWFCEGTKVTIGSSAKVVQHEQPIKRWKSKPKRMEQSRWSLLLLIYPGRQPWSTRTPQELGRYPFSGLKKRWNLAAGLPGTFCFLSVAKHLLFVTSCQAEGGCIVDISVSQSYEYWPGWVLTSCCCCCQPSSVTFYKLFCPSSGSAL